MTTQHASNSDLFQQLANDPVQAIARLKDLIPAVASSDESTMQWATEALENCGPPEEAQLPWLASQLQDPSEDVAYWACTLIGRAGLLANSLQCQLAETLKNRTGASRLKAASALGKIGKLNESSIVELRKAASETNLPALASAAQRALEQAGA